MPCMKRVEGSWIFLVLVCYLEIVSKLLYNFHRGNEISGVHDPLFTVMEQSKICESGDKFVLLLLVCVYSPLINQQLTDLVRFSTVIVSVSCPLIQPFPWEILMSHVLLIKTCLCLTLEVVNVLFCLALCWFINENSLRPTTFLNQSWLEYALLLLMHWLSVLMVAGVIWMSKASLT